MNMSDTQLGWIQFMGAFGFPIATLIGRAFIQFIRS